MDGSLQRDSQQNSKHYIVAGLPYTAQCLLRFKYGVLGVITKALGLAKGRGEGLVKGRGERESHWRKQQSQQLGWADQRTPETQEGKALHSHGHLLCFLVT